MSKYSKQHYEDVARLLSQHVGPCVSRSETNCLTMLVAEFAGLFAADNPGICPCGSTDSTVRYCFRGETISTTSKRHILTGGFNRNKFLTACGLREESKPDA